MNWQIIGLDNDYNNNTIIMEPKTMHTSKQKKDTEQCDELDFRLQQDGISSMFSLERRLDRPPRRNGHLPTLDQIEESWQDPMEI